MLVDAEALFGKTAWSLAQVERTLAAGMQTDKPEPLALDGWAFARGSKGQLLPQSLSGDAETVTAQLDSCTRHRLALPYTAEDPARKLKGRERWEELLKHCAVVALERKAHNQGPVLLLLDGVDEAYEDIGELLPTAWPSGVVLILAGRTSAFQRVRRGRPSKLALPREEIEAIQQHVQEDLRKYIVQRAAHILGQYGHDIEPRDRQAIQEACQGVFFVAAELLRRSETLVEELKDWRANPDLIPKGPRKALERQIARVEGAFVERARARGITRSKEVVQPLLCWLALSGQAWTVDQVCNLLIPGWAKYAAADDLFDQAWHADAALQNLADRVIVREVLDCARDLMNRGDSADQGMRFWHEFLRDVLVEAAREQGWAGPLHALWGLLCEFVFAREEALPLFGQAIKLEKAMRREALLAGPLHLALASNQVGDERRVWWNSEAARLWRAECWKRGATRMLDIRPEDSSHGREVGYLQRLFEHTDPHDPDLRNEAWTALQRCIAALLAIGAACPDDQLAVRLRSLRHVLADQHDEIAEGSTPLLMALFNRMAGRWTGDSSWGDLLRRCSSSMKRPWLRAAKVHPSLALGPLFAQLDSGICCMATCADGSYIAVGTVDGAVWVWSSVELESGLPGTVATRHMGRVNSVSIVAASGGKRWWIGSGESTARQEWYPVASLIWPSARIAVGGSPPAIWGRSTVSQWL